MKNITILGATGSIGTNTLKIIDLHPDKINIIALSANSNTEKMLELCKKYSPKYAVMADKNSAKIVQNNIQTNTKVLAGSEALDFVASLSEVDMVMCAIVGASGMSSTLSAAKSGKKVLLANKESLVLAGDILIKIANENNAEIIPVDSEHSAIFQALNGNHSGVKKIQLTASGGPFFNTPLKDLINITPKQACNHPNWSMGKKISVDSATMMNKGLELIEAYYLFNIKQIDVLIHPQSIVHSSVYYKDGSVISQLGNPDMRTAISYSMFYPYREYSGVDDLDLTKQNLEFYKVDFNKFKNLDLAYNALNSGASFMIALNASNEIAVEAFLNRKIGFLDIAKINEKVLHKTTNTKLTNIEDILEKDQESRIKSCEFI